MSDHDPLCLDMTLRAKHRHERGACHCDLIDRVRQEQYSRQAQTWEQGYAAGVQAARDAVAAELGWEDSDPSDDYKPHTVIWKFRALAAIDGLRGES